MECEGCNGFERFDCGYKELPSLVGCSFSPSSLGVVETETPCQLWRIEILNRTDSGIIRKYIDQRRDYEMQRAAPSLMPKTDECVACNSK